MSSNSYQDAVGFVQLLKDLGYETVPKDNRQDIQPELFEWAFEIYDTKPQLQFLMNHITPGVNALYPQELKWAREQGFPTLHQFEEIHYDDLKERDSLEKLPNFIDALSIIQELETELEEESEYGSQLNKQVDKMAGTVRDLEAEIKALEEAQSFFETELLEQNRELETSSSLLDSTIDSIQERLQLVMNEFGQISEDNKDSQSTRKLLLHEQADMLTDLEALDNKFNETLSKYFRKQFPQGMAVVLAESSDQGFENEADKAYVQGESEEGYTSNKNEMNRLKKLFPKCEMDYLYNVLETEYSRLFLEALEIESTRSAAYCKEIESLRVLKNDYRDDINHLRKQIRQCVSLRAQPVIKDLSDLEIKMPILTGDYALKQIRQEYMIERLEKVIELLESQKSRHDFLSVSFDAELENHKTLAQIANSVIGEVRGRWKEVAKRLELLSDASFQIDYYSKQAIDSQDTLLLHIKDIMESNMGMDEPFIFQQKGKENHFLLDSDQTSLFTTVESLRQKCLQLVSTAKNMEEASSTAQRKCSQIGDELLDGVKTLILAVYRDTSATEICMIPKQLYILQDSLKEAIEDLRVKFTETSKTKQMNDTLQYQKKLFYLFHCDQQQLKQYINNMEEKIQRLEVQQ